MDIHLLERLKDIVRSAGTTVRSAQDAAMGIREKSSHVDLVTLYDPMVQEFLRSRLMTLLPEAGFLGEEDATHDIAGRRQLFIVDPIDGTMNFIRGLHHSAISVALAVDGVVTHAVVYNPYYDEMFSAQRGKGAWLNGQRLHVTQHAVHDSLVLFGSAIYYRETIPETLRFVEALLPNCLDFRRGGSAALDCCYVAAGRADLFFECRLCPWDYAAGGLIVTEAGGIATQLDGSPLALTQRGSVAMGNAVNHPELLAIARRMGLETENCAGNIGWADLPGKSKKQIATITHLDVVPAGNGWTSDPFEMIVKDGCVIGRGTLDDKGPAVLTLYIAKFFKERGEQLPYTLRLLFGTDEETGMEDVEWYLEHHDAPAFLFTPDGEFPVGYGEKGGYGGDVISAPVSGNLMEFEGGVAGNVVPDKASALVKADISVLSSTGRVTVEPAGNGLVRITGHGVGGHASMPWWWSICCRTGCAAKAKTARWKCCTLCFPPRTVPASALPAVTMCSAR